MFHTLRILPEQRYLCCLMVQREAPMNKTQPGGRNRTRWKVFTRTVHRNVTQNDESEAAEQGFFMAFTLTVMQIFFLPHNFSGRKSSSITENEQKKTLELAFVSPLL